MKAIDKIIGLNDIKLGENSYFSNNILQSLVQKQLSDMIGMESPNLKDLIELSAGGKFGKNKKWGADITMGPSKEWEMKISKGFK
tara:strand:+ start:1119 stop:1373 length:255 start_codon:yes stop_codon:yes gene_type:complete